MSWILVLIVFLGPQPIDSKILGAETEAECREAREKVLDLVKQAGAEPWAECVEVKRDPKKTVYKIERNA